MFTRDDPSGTDKTLAPLYAAVAARPSDTRALVRLADAAAKVGNAPLASEAYSRAGNVFLSQSAARPALAAFTSALQVARDGALADRVARIARAVWKINLNEGLTNEALATLDTTAKWLLERGFDADAMPLLEARIDIEDSDSARLQLADTLGRLKLSSKAEGQLLTVFMRFQAQGRRDKALEVGERLLAIRRDVEIARECAVVYLARNQPGDAFHAIAKLRICHEDSPTHRPTLELLARAFELAGHPDKAKRVREEIASFGTPPPGARKKRSVSVALPSKPGVTETSVTSLSIADVELVSLEQSPSRPPPPLIETSTLGTVDALAGQGRYEEALAALDHALARAPHDVALSERKKEIVAIRTSHLKGPPPALFGPGERRGDSVVRRGKRKTV